MPQLFCISLQNCKYLDFISPMFQFRHLNFFEAVWRLKTAVASATITLELVVGKPRIFEDLELF